jgi:hypothetical protein
MRESRSNSRQSPKAKMDAEMAPTALDLTRLHRDVLSASVTFFERIVERRMICQMRLGVGVMFRECPTQGDIGSLVKLWHGYRIQ